MVEVSLTVGKLDASLALLLTKDHHLIEFPTILLPDGIVTGSIVKITCDRDLKQERVENEQFEKLQEEIFETFGKNEPQKPVLKVVNVTQTSCVLEWEPLSLGTAELKSLTLFKNGAKLGQIGNAKSKKNIKLSGLPVDTAYKFQLRMDTTAGVYFSDVVPLQTHKMTDLSGISVCVGEIDFDEETQFTLQDIKDVAEKIGARKISTKVRIDTTQFVCTQLIGDEYEKAKSMNIPVVRPEWLKACELERRIVGVNKFYINAEKPLWKEKDFWNRPVREERIAPQNLNQLADDVDMNKPLPEKPLPEKPLPDKPVETEAGAEFPGETETETEKEDTAEKADIGGSLADHSRETLPTPTETRRGTVKELKEEPEVLKNLTNDEKEPELKEIEPKKVAEAPVETEEEKAEIEPEKPEEVKDEVKEEPKDEVKDESKEESKEEVKEEPKEEVKEEPKEEVKEEPTETTKEVIKEEPKEPEPVSAEVEKDIAETTPPKIEEPQPATPEFEEVDMNDAEAAEKKPTTSKKKKKKKKAKK